MASKKNFIGSWAFVVGIILALILGIFMDQLTQNYQDYLIWALVLIGLVVGILNVTSRETTPFLTSGLVLILASVFGAGVMRNLPLLPNILTAILMIFVPATIVVSIRNVFNFAKN